MSIKGGGESVGADCINSTVTDARPFTAPHTTSGGPKEQEQQRQRGAEPLLASQSGSAVAAAAAARRKERRRNREDDGSSSSSSTSFSDGEDEGEIFQDANDRVPNEGGELERRTRALRLLDDEQEEEDDTAMTAASQRRVRAPPPSGGTTVVQKKIVIDTVHGDVHIGPQLVQNLNCGGGGRVSPGGSGGNSNRSYKRSKKSLSEEEKQHIMTCAKSKRLVGLDELYPVAGRVGLQWKSVGYGLKLHHAVLDQIDADCEGELPEKVELMLKRWIMFRAERATVARLTKALFNHSEYDAIAAVRP